MSKSISKEIKKNGKVSFDGPTVKQRKHFAPATKVEKAKKGKGSYNRKAEEDEQLPAPPSEIHVGDTSNYKKKKGKSSKSKHKIDENTNIEKFIESILTKNYASADKYIKQAVECKLQSKIELELSTPLF